MPVKIKHKQLKQIKWINYQDYIQNYVNNDLYETLYIKNVYDLYNRKSGTELFQTSIEKEEAETALLKHPDIFRIAYSGENTQSKFFANLDLSNNQFVHHTIKYTVRIISKAWKIILTISTILITAYLGSGNHFDNLIKWLKDTF
jgi:hypothetical protein